jgi:hypothetical protein
MIQTIGLFWNESDVFWGKGKQPGRLLGVPENRRTAEPTDFRDQVGIYVLYADFDLVYVGQTGIGERKLLDRLKDHRKHYLRDRWNKFSWFGLRRVLGNNTLSKIIDAMHPELPDVLNHLEAILIDTAEPHLNLQGGRFDKKKVHWYIQVRDERLGPSETDMIRRIYEKNIPAKIKDIAEKNRDTTSAPA